MVKKQLFQKKETTQTNAWKQAKNKKNQNEKPKFSFVHSLVGGLLKQHCHCEKERVR